MILCLKMLQEEFTTDVSEEASHSSSASERALLIRTRSLAPVTTSSRIYAVLAIAAVVIALAGAVNFGRQVGRQQSITSC